MKNPSLPRRHSLKTWPEMFQAIQRGDKTFECRLDDRSFCVGDTLALEEFDPTTEYHVPRGYTGRRVEAVITFKLSGSQFGIESGYCVLSFKVIE